MLSGFWGRMKTGAVVKNAAFPFPSAAVLLLVRRFFLQPVSKVERGSTFQSPQSVPRCSCQSGFPSIRHQGDTSGSGWMPIRCRTTLSDFGGNEALEVSRGGSRTGWKDYTSRLAWNAWGPLREEEEGVGGEKEVWDNQLSLLPS